MSETSLSFKRPGQIWQSEVIANLRQTLKRKAEEIESLKEQVEENKKNCLRLETKEHELEERVEDP